MKTLFCPEPNSLVVKDSPEPTISSSLDVIVTIKSVGICGSDGGRFKWENALLKMPHIGGHEYSGVVAKVGSDVERIFPHIKVGTRVTGMPIDHCSECDVCKSGLTQHCAKRRVLGAHPTWPGAFAEQISTHAKLLVPIPDEISFEMACTTEPSACSTWAGDRCELFSNGTLKGKNGFIAGAGPIGILAMQDVIARGANKVIVSDTDESRLAAVKALGGIPIDARESKVIEEVPKIFGSLADFSIDCVGLGITRDQCGFVTKPYQPSAWVGLHEDFESKVSAGQYVRRGVVSVGVFAYSPKSFLEALCRLTKGSMGFKQSDTIVCGFNEGQKWFDKLFNDTSNGKPLKVIFDPSI